MSTTSSRLRELDELYDEMHASAFHRDRSPTPLVRRPVEPRVLESRVMLLAQGLARGTQRVTASPIAVRTA